MDDRGSGKSGGAFSSKNVTENVIVVVLPVNDPPTVVLRSGNLLTVVEGGTLRLNSVTVSDVDVDDAHGASMEVNVTLHAKDSASVLHVPANTISGVWFVQTNTSFASMRGSLTSLNDALAVISYQPGPNYSGKDALFFVVSDLGNTGSGGPLKYNTF